MWYVKCHKKYKLLKFIIRIDTNSLPGNSITLFDPSIRAIFQNKLCFEFEYHADCISCKELKVTFRCQRNYVFDIPATT